MKIVAGAKPGEAVGPLQELVADARAPFGSDRSEVGDRTDVQVFTVVPANHHRNVFSKPSGSVTSK